MYYLILFIVSIGFMFLLSMVIEKIILVMLLTFIILIATQMLFFTFFVLYSVKKFDKDCNPLGFIKRGNWLLKFYKPHQQMFIHVQINRAVAFIEMGKFEDAIKVLESLNINNKLFSNIVVRFTYYNNLIYAYYNLNKVDEAEVIFNERFKELYDQSKNIRSLTEAVQMFDAIRLFYLKAYEESKIKLESILDLPYVKRRNVVAMYFLAKIAELNGDIEEAMKKFKIVAQEGNILYVAQEAKNILNQINR